MALYLFEQLCKFYDDDSSNVIPGLKGTQFKANYPKSVPVSMTAVHRKKELRDKVDVNFDGRVSLLEYLLYQYNASPKDLMDRQTPTGLPAEVLAAMAALADVNKKVQAYEAEKARLEEDANAAGIKGLRAKNELAQLVSGPLWEQVNTKTQTSAIEQRVHWFALHAGIYSPFFLFPFLFFSFSRSTRR